MVRFSLTREKAAACLLAVADPPSLLHSYLLGRACRIPPPPTRWVVVSDRAEVQQQAGYRGQRLPSRE